MLPANALLRVRTALDMAGAMQALHAAPRWQAATAAAREHRALRQNVPWVPLLPPLLPALALPSPAGLCLLIRWRCLMGAYAKVSLPPGTPQTAPGVVKDGEPSMQVQVHHSRCRTHMQVEHPAAGSMCATVQGMEAELCMSRHAHTFLQCPPANDMLAHPFLVMPTHVTQSHLPGWQATTTEPARPQPAGPAASP